MSHYIYVIANSPEGPVKIGRSEKPEKRLRQLQVANSSILTLYYKKPFSLDRIKVVETGLHEEFVDRRVHGEWFDVGVMDAIEMIESVHSK